MFARDKLNLINAIILISTSKGICMDDNQDLSPKIKTTLKWTSISIGVVIGAYFSFNLVIKFLG